MTSSVPRLLIDTCSIINLSYCTPVGSVFRSRYEGVAGWARATQAELIRQRSRRPHLQGHAEPARPDRDHDLPHFLTRPVGRRLPAKILLQHGSGKPASPSRVESPFSESPGRLCAWPRRPVDHKRFSQCSGRSRSASRRRCPGGIGVRAHLMGGSKEPHRRPRDRWPASGDCYLRRTKNSRLLKRPAGRARR